MLTLREDALLHQVVLVPRDRCKRRLAVEPRADLLDDLLVGQLTLDQVVPAPSADVVLQSDLDTVHRHSLISHFNSPVTLNHH